MEWLDLFVRGKLDFWQKGKVKKKKKKEKIKALGNKITVDLEFRTAKVKFHAKNCFFNFCGDYLICSQ